MIQENQIIKTEIPPNDFEAEQGVLSCMLYDSYGLQSAYDMLKKDDFYRQEHIILFSEMIDMFTNGKEVDYITLKSKLESSNQIGVIGGADYILELNNIVSTSFSIKHYAEIVIEKSIRRKVLTASKSIKKLSFDTNETVESIVEKSERIISEIVIRSSEQDFTHIKEVLQTSLENLEKLYITKSQITGIPTGFKDFDLKTSGLQKSDLILIAGRPSMGKTAFAINIAQNVSLKSNITTAIFSLEMSKEQLINRMICTEAQVEAQKLRTGDLEGQDWYKIAEAISVLSEAPIYIDDRTSVSLQELKSKCRKLKNEKDLGLIVIDYLQLMSAGGKMESRQQEISKISRELKGLARELNIPIIALSQLSRSVEQRRPPRPMLSDLRESGAIEQDADVVCFLYREEYYEPDTEKKGLAEVIIAKQRNGSVGSINLMWLSNYTKFGNYEMNYNDYSNYNGTNNY